MFLRSKVWQICRADNLTAICEQTNYVELLTSHNPIGLQGLLQDSFTLLYHHHSRLDHMSC
jgi:hypothetical protein